MQKVIAAAALLAATSTMALAQQTTATDIMKSDIDKVLAELGIDQPTTPAHNSMSAPSPDGSQAPTRPTAAPAKPLLAVNMRVLKASDELKRMFGAAAMHEEAEDAGAAYAGVGGSPGPGWALCRG